MPTSVNFNNTSYSIPLEGELNWPALSNFLVSVGNNTQTTGKQKIATRVALSTPVSVSDTTDCLVITDLTVAGAVAVNLPAGVTGRVFTVVDGKGDAGTNNITITPLAGTINGAATYVIDSNSAGVTLVYDGAMWRVTAEFISAGDIPRDQIAAGTANHVVINDGSGDLSSEATLAQTRGGLATDASAFGNGFLKKGAGVFNTSAILEAELPSNINAEKIGGGLVTNAEFAYISSLTSNAQSQINERVSGPASSTDNAVARFDLTTGKLVQDSGVIIDDSNNMSGVVDIGAGGDVTVNKSGNDAASEGAGLVVDRTGTKGSLIYANAATSRFKVGDLGAEVEIATISDAQIITNKDIDGGTAANNRRVTVPKDTLVNLQALTRKEGTIVYATDTTRAYYDNGTSLVEIGSSSGVGFGISPPGAIIPIAANITGAFTIPASGTVSADGWMYCDGAAIPGSQTLSGNTPNLTGSRFLMGSTVAGTTGGAASVTLAEANLPSHTHGLNSHTHTITHTHTINHTHTGITTPTTGSEHQHSIRYDDAGSSSTLSAVLSGTTLDGTSINFVSTGTGANFGAHDHTGGSTPAYSGSSGASSAASTGTPSTASTTAAGSGTSFSILPTYLSTIYLIRVI